jgi:Flp pilus assembly protein CpaB
VRNWRVLTAVLAVVLAALAGVLVWKYVDDQKNEAKKPYQQVPVLVAAQNVPAGTSFASALDSKMIKSEARTRKDLPDAYVSGEQSPNDLKTQFDQLIAAHDITQNETITRNEFVAATSAAATGGVSGELATDSKPKDKKDLQAVTLAFDSEHSIGGFVNPNDYVNVIAHMEVHDLTSPNDKPVKMTAFLLPHIKVLAVGATTAVPQQNINTDSSTPTTQAPAVQQGLITLEVTPRQAEQLIQGREDGSLWLSLNPPTWQPGDFQNPAEIVEAVNLFDQPLPQLQQLFQQIRNAPKS